MNKKEIINLIKAELADIDRRETLGERYENRDLMWELHVARHTLNKILEKAEA